MSLDKLYQEYAKQLTKLEVVGEVLRPVFGCGSVNAKLMLIGEAPGVNETEAGEPFVGQAGKQLNEFLAEVALDRQALFITNAVKYRPYKLSAAGRKSNRTPTKKEIQFGATWLAQEIEYIRPKIIATLGNSPLNALLPHSKETIGALHGTMQKYQNYLLVPLYHPASLIYNHALEPTYRADMKFLKQLLEQA